MKKLSLLAAGLFSFTILIAQPAREKILFDNDWKFHFGHAADASKDFNFSIAPIFSKSGKGEKTPMDPKFDDSSWRSLDVPHDWAVELPFVKSENFDVMAHGYKPVGGLFPETSIGWYRKTFTITRADSGRRLSLQFDGIFRDSKIWLNGFYLGNNESGYVGIAYDITDYVYFDKPNVLVVRADASQYEGWFYEGPGIYRHVWLNKYNPFHIGDHVFVHTRVLDRESEVYVEIPVVNHSLLEMKGQVTCTLVDRNGRTIAGADVAEVTVAPGGAVNMKQSIRISNPVLWSVDNPYLYRVNVKLSSVSNPIDVRNIKIGIRTIAISAEKGLLVNNVPVKIKGVNCHQDHAGVGSALPDYLQYYRIRLLKELGANAYRTSHHAPAPELLEACDSLGILVLDEARLLNSSPEYMDQFRRLILRDRNHASVFLWSIGNEEGYAQTQSTGKRIALTMLQLQQQLDPTRTSTYAADLGNVYSGVNEVIPVRGFNYREKFVIPYHQDHPAQPVLGTEMGSTVTTRGIYAIDSVRAYLPDQDITAPWWASTAEAWWPTAATHDWYMGGFIWTGFDYRGEPTPFQWPNISSHFGIMDMCGFPKNLYYYYQSWWSSQDVIHISPHWNWTGRESKPIEVWINSNAEEVELLLNGKSLGRKPMPRNSHLKWTVGYKPGKLEAIGYSRGKTFRTKVETTTAPYTLQLETDRNILTGNGRDATVVNVRILDKKGREIPDANLPVSFSIAGPGKILGGGNGDPSSHEADVAAGEKYERKLFNGRCQVILQTRYGEGALILQAVAPGVEKATVSIQVGSPGLKVSKD